VSKIIVGNVSPVYGQTAISVPSATNIRPGGSVIQVRTARSDVITTYSAPNSGIGTTITDLNLTIAPKSANNYLLFRWSIAGESNHNVNFLIHRDGALITDSGYQGFNNVVGNVNLQSGYVTSWYDNNTDSTGTMYWIQYYIRPSNTNSRTYAPAVRSSENGAAYTFFFNRVAASAGQDNQENAVSNGIVMEIVP
jgi:hypothetical protein